MISIKLERDARAMNAMAMVFSPAVPYLGAKILALVSRVLLLMTLLGFHLIRLLRVGVPFSVFCPG